MSINMQSFTNYLPCISAMIDMNLIRNKKYSGGYCYRKIIDDGVVWWMKPECFTIKSNPEVFHFSYSTTIAKGFFFFYLLTYTCFSHANYPQLMIINYYFWLLVVFSASSHATGKILRSSMEVNLRVWCGRLGRRFVPSSIDLIATLGNQWPSIWRIWPVKCSLLWVMWCEGYTCRFYVALLSWRYGHNSRF